MTAPAQRTLTAAMAMICQSWSAGQGTALMTLPKTAAAFPATVMGAVGWEFLEGISAKWGRDPVPRMRTAKEPSYVMTTIRNAGDGERLQLFGSWYIWKPGTLLEEWPYKLGGTRRSLLQMS